MGIGELAMIKTMLRYMTTAVCTLPILGVAAYAQESPNRANIEKARPPINCADFTNLGTTNPKLLNSCNDGITVNVVNYDRNGVKVAERVFHLWHKEARPIAFPGYEMFIDWEKGWSNDGADDGSQFLTLWHHDISGSDVWEARNTSSDRFNAFQAIVYENGRRCCVSYLVLPPGQSGRLYSFYPPDKGTLVLEWSRLDPK
jgi:hypothetical protein